MAAFERPTLGEARQPAKTRVLGARVLLGLGILVAASMVVTLPMIAGQMWAVHRSERLCADAPAVGASIDVQRFALEALDRGGTVNFDVRTAARREEVLNSILSTPLGAREPVYVHIDEERPESVSAYWRMMFFTSDCHIDYERGVVTAKRITNLD